MSGQMLSSTASHVQCVESYLSDVHHLLLSIIMEPQLISGTNFGACQSVRSVRRRGWLVSALLSEVLCTLATYQVLHYNSKQ